MRAASRSGIRAVRASLAPSGSQVRCMAMAENFVTPRDAEETATLLGQRYGVAPTPGCQLQPPDIHGWTPKVEEPTPPKPVPSVVTVFGGTGMIGKSLIKKLSGKFEKIRVATRDPVKAQATFSGVSGLEFVSVDLDDYDTIELACRGSGTVVNCIGILYETSTETFHKVQYMASKYIAAAARAAEVDNMLHVSAIGSADASLSNYAKTKGWGEACVRTTFPKATIFKPSVVFGPEDNFFNQFANFPLPFIPLVGGGNTKFQPVYVEDVTDAITKCATSDVGRGKTFELGGPDVYSFKELMNKVADITGSKKPQLPVPFIAAEIQGWFMEIVQPVPMVTKDQVELLKSDNVVAEDAATFKELGLTPKTVDDIVPTYLR